MKKRIFGLLIIVAALYQCKQESITHLSLSIDASKETGAIDLTRYSLGQGGLSPDPMIDAQLPQLKQLHPRTIRFFIQEYFGLYPQKGVYNWTSLDKTLDAIIATGARPIPNICFKPKVLFPKLDQYSVIPSSWQEWDELVYQLVKHCREKNYGIEYWEIGNEVDLGEPGGCPYLYKPADYLTFYKHTTDAVLKADTAAKVGGPALSNCSNPIGDSLIAYCARGNAPLDFFSFHGYNDDPVFFQKCIKYVIHDKLGKYPELKNTETMITEWNMGIFAPDLNPYFQPAFILEMTNMFHKEGLSAAAFYHIRDYYVDPAEFSFLSETNVELFANMFNIMPYFGMFDNQGRVRPAYYAMQCLSLMKGQELDVTGIKEDMRAVSVSSGKWINTVFWNYPPDKNGKTYECTVNFSNIKEGSFRILRLNPESAVNNIESIRYGSTSQLSAEPIRIKLAPYEIVWVEIRP